VLEFAPHAGVKRWVQDLNRLYRERPELHEMEFDAGSFQWIDASDADNSVLSFLRRGKDPNSEVLVLCNFTPVPRPNYRVGVPRGGIWKELLNGDAEIYGGSGQGNLGGVEAAPLPLHGQTHSLTLVLPPLSVLFLAPA
jgi:1,4-alpha-glucan branching enzyme